MTMLYVIIGAVVGAAILLGVVVTVIALATKSAASSSAAAAEAAMSQSPAPPPVVRGRPSAVHPRFVPSQHHQSPGYSGFHNNGYCDNEPPTYDHYPYFYHSRITVHSD